MTSLDFRYAENRWKVTSTHSQCSFMCYYSSYVHIPRRKEVFCLNSTNTQDLRPEFVSFGKKIALIFLPALF